MVRANPQLVRTNILFNFFCTNILWGQIFFVPLQNRFINQKPFAVKQKLLYVILLFVIVLNVKAVGIGYTNERPVLFGIATDYPPLEYIDPDGTPCGYDIEFTKKLMNRLHLPLDCKAMPWGSIPRAAIDGKIDLSLMTFSTYRQDSIHYSRAVFKLHYQIVYRNDKISRHVDMRRLGGKKVAYLSSKPVSDTLTAIGAVPLIVPNLRQAMQDLANGLYDAVICYRYQAKFITEKYSLTGLSFEDFTLTPREYCYASCDKELINLINVELDEMEEEGIIYNIYSPAGVYLDTPEIPQWVWYLLVAIIFLFLIIFIILQQLYQKMLKREMRRAQRSERAKTAFLGNVSHILRTPLNAINGFSEVLKSDEKGALSAEERIQLATLVHDNGERLLYFINELLTLSNIEGNELKFNRTKVELRAAMESYAEETRELLHKGVKLHVVGPKDCYVHIDEKFLHIITKHFLDNAAQHTESGNITLTYQLKNSRLYVEVKDTGHGVPEELRKNIFSLLTEKATAVQDEIPGLGLTICKAVVDHCNGDIGLVSPPEGGACFWYWVPLKKI